MKLSVRRGIAMGASLALVLLASAAPAGAANQVGAVKSLAATIEAPTPGATTYRGSNSTLSNLPRIGPGYITSGNIVAMWQNILFLDGYLNQCVSVNPSNSIDGVFGNNTKAATKAWQAANGLTADGIVGPKTWAKLQSKLVYDNYYTQDRPADYWYYVGKISPGGKTIFFGRPTDTNSYWAFNSLSNPNGPQYPIQWTSRTVRTC